MPAKLCAVEPEPENVEWIRGHFTDNGLDADDHWIVPLALSNQREPVFFPVGAAGSGAQNCYSTNECHEEGPSPVAASSCHQENDPQGGPSDSVVRRTGSFT